MKLFVLMLLTIIISLTFISANNSLALSCSVNLKPSSKLALQGATELGGSCSGKTITAPGGLVTTIVNIITYVAGVIVIFMIIFAGFRYITSTGDANKVNSAKNNLIYALIGLAVIVLADTIVSYVISQLKG